jgi:hypothetical protein
MTPLYNDDFHIRARERERANYNSINTSFRYYRKKLKLTNEQVEELFGDVWSDPALMQKACDTWKSQFAMRRRQERNRRALLRENERLDRLIQTGLMEKATPSMKKHMEEVENEVVDEEDERITGMGVPAMGDSTRCATCGDWKDYACEDIYICMNGCGSA